MSDSTNRIDSRLEVARELERAGAHGRVALEQDQRGGADEGDGRHGLGSAAGSFLGAVYRAYRSEGAVLTAVTANTVGRVIGDVGGALMSRVAQPEWGIGRG